MEKKIFQTKRRQQVILCKIKWGKKVVKLQLPVFLKTSCWSSQSSVQKFQYKNKRSRSLFFSLPLFFLLSFLFCIILNLPRAVVFTKIVPFLISHLLEILLNVQTMTLKSFYVWLLKLQPIVTNIQFLPNIMIYITTCLI